jgi:hypothetical protein
MVPVSGGVTTSLAYQPQLNDKVYLYNGSGYDQMTFAKNRTTGLTNWTPAEPSVNVGQGFWLNFSTAGTVWSNNFLVK